MLWEKPAFMAILKTTSTFIQHLLLVTEICVANKQLRSILTIKKNFKRYTNAFFKQFQLGKIKIVHQEPMSDFTRFPSEQDLNQQSTCVTQ